MEGNKVAVTSGKTHNVINILGIVGLSICFILTAIFNGLAGSGNTTFFNTVTGNISDKYELDTTPAGWTFSIWVSNIMVNDVRNMCEIK